MAENLKNHQKNLNSGRAEAEAKQLILDDIFNDVYRSRRRIYRLNFVRGIFFGLGSAIGGVILFAILIAAVTFVMRTFFPGVASDFVDWIFSR